MARGGMPMRPTGGGRPPTPPRRSAQTRAPQRTGTSKQAQQQQTQRLAQQQRQQQQQRIAQQRVVQQQQAARAQQQRVRQQVFLRQAHGDRQEAEAVRRTEELRDQITELETILATGLERPASIDLAGLPQAVEPEPFDPGPLAEPAPEPTWEQFAPGLLTGRLGGQTWKKRREVEAQDSYEQARAAWQVAEQERTERLEVVARRHAERVAEGRAEVDAYNRRVARVTEGLRERDPAAVESFLRTVLRRVPLPAGLPRRAAVTFHPVPERAEVRMVLPPREVVPAVAGYEYAAGPDEIRAVERPADECAGLYQRVVAQVMLLVVRDLLEADPDLAGVLLHGLVPAEDDPRRAVCLVSVDADRDGFEALELAQAPAEALLERLEARVSVDPYGYRPVEPIRLPA